MPWIFQSFLMLQAGVNLEIPHLMCCKSLHESGVCCSAMIKIGKEIRFIFQEKIPRQPHAKCLDFESYPELSQGVDVLGFQKGVVVTVHQTFTMHYSCIVHQYCDISHLMFKKKKNAINLSILQGLCLFFLLSCDYTGRCTRAVSNIPRFYSHISEV